MAEALTALFGPALTSDDGTVETAEAFNSEGLVSVGIYFASADSKEITDTVSKAYDQALSAKGLEIVFVSCDESEAGATTAFADMPWWMLPYESEQRRALIEKFEVQEHPRLVIVDLEGNVAVADGMSKISADPAGDNFPWKDEDGPPTLSEADIMVRLGAMPPEPGQGGLKGIFINSKNYVALGLVDQAEESDDVPFSGMNLKPYVHVSKQMAIDEVRKMGFASDFHPYQKDIDKFPGDELLLIFDPDRGYDEKLIFPTTQAAFDRETARFAEARGKIIEEFEQSLIPEGAAAGEEGIDDEPEENIVVRDLPKECCEWKSETMETTHHEVTNFTVHNSRPPMQVMISRPRAQFGKNNFKFSDSGENLHNCRPQKDPNYTMQRKELEIGIQSVKDTRTVACQTTWFRPVNKSTQYSPNDFLKDKVDSKIVELSEFLSAVSNSVEEALQTNETVDIFQEEFKNLGDEEAGAVSKTHSL